MVQLNSCAKKIVGLLGVCIGLMSFTVARGAMDPFGPECDKIRDEYHRQVARCPSARKNLSAHNACKAKIYKKFKRQLDACDPAPGASFQFSI